MSLSLRRARAAAQLLHRPAAVGLYDAVRRLLAVQAQDLRNARLALRARVDGLAAADVNAALADGALVVAWLNRGTLHLVAAEDYPWLLALSAPGRFTANARRLRQEGVPPADAERAVAIIDAALADEGPLTRVQLGERLAARGIRTAGQALPHLLMLAVLRGVAVLGPVGESGQAFALARDWVAAGGTRGGRATSAIDDTDRDRALAELARRYLAGHGPASAHDLAAWSGLPLRDARAALAAIAPELAERDDGLIELATLDPPPELPIPPRLLPSFDPYLLGWKDRSVAVAARHGRRVHPGGGMLRATATVDGKMVGTWTLPGGTVDLDLFARVDTAGRAALRVEADEIERFVR